MYRITIIKDAGSYSYHVISDGYPPKLASHLTYDEMLGYIARTMCPQDSDGSIPCGFGRPLFLEPPKEEI